MVACTPSPALRTNPKSTHSLRDLRGLALLASPASSASSFSRLLCSSLTSSIASLTRPSSPAPASCQSCSSCLEGLLLAARFTGSLIRWISLWMPAPRTASPRIPHLNSPPQLPLILYSIIPLFPLRPCHHLRPSRLSTRLLSVFPRRMSAPRGRQGVCLVYDCTPRHSLQSSFKKTFYIVT